MASTRKPGSRLPLQARVTCPHCWTRFAPGDICWVASHPGLQGDPLLGRNEQRRFLPTRFTVEGLALDVKGETCKILACPNCHLIIPRVLLESEPLFLSIIGSPSSGKSYFLAAMTWQARQTLSQKLGVSFVDPDPDVNQILNGFENTLFYSTEPAQLVRLEKTQQQGALYNSVMRGDRTTWYPHPFVFSIGPKEPSASMEENRRFMRALCLYDNAGEHFLPGGKIDDSTATNHLSLSRALLFLFDPIQHPKFRQACSRVSVDPQLGRLGALHRQDQVLSEAAKRIRSQTGLSHLQKSPQPLIVALTKYDVWAGLLGNKRLARDWALCHHQSSKTALDLAAVREVSALMETMLRKYAPEVVDAAEGLSQDVVYIPVSALGRSPVVIAGDHLAIRPGDIQPHGVEVPLLYALHRTMGKLIPAIKQPGRNSLWHVMQRRPPELPPLVTTTPAESAAQPAGALPGDQTVALRAVPREEDAGEDSQTLPFKETGS